MKAGLTAAIVIADRGLLLLRRVGLLVGMIGSTNNPVSASRCRR
jgi:hypothetical protein